MDTKIDSWYTVGINKETSILNTLSTEGKSKYEFNLEEILKTIQLQYIWD